MLVASTLPEMVAEVIQSDYPGYFVTDNKGQTRNGTVPMWTKTPDFPCRVNLSAEEYYQRTLPGALKTTGYWFSGRPSRAFQVVGINARGNEEEKYAAQSFVLKRECEPSEIKQAIRRNSATFGEFEDELANQQWLWYVALGRPERNREKVIQGLETALKVRDLSWKLEEFPTARAAWDARAARDARAALTVDFSSRNKWVDFDPLRLSLGLRDAYHNGLGIALPTGPDTLGWAMDEETNQ